MIGKYPNIRIVVINADLGFIGMYKLPGDYVIQNFFIRIFIDFTRELKWILESRQ